MSAKHTVWGIMLYRAHCRMNQKITLSIMIGALSGGRPELRIALILQQTCLKQTGVHCKQCAPQVATDSAHAAAIWLPHCQLVPLCQSISLCGTSHIVYLAQSTSETVCVHLHRHDLCHMICECTARCKWYTGICYSATCEQSSCNASQSTW